MTVKEFIKSGGSRVNFSIKSGESNVLPSVTDPTQAQSGRDLVFNPKPIRNTRVTYYGGVPAAELQPFDKMYADKLDVFHAAKAINNNTHEKIKSFEAKQAEEAKKQSTN